MKKLSLLILTVTIAAAATFAQTAKTPATAKQTKVLIETEFGNMTAILYNETPLHRDNFIKLANQGWYNGSIFHRVINNFMIQGGGKDDKMNDPGYKVPAEFVGKYFHKKGALAAARQPDQVNPQKASSGSQFYIVQGTILTDAQMNQEVKVISPERREIYKTIGGVPRLDDDYTVFGQVIEGLEVVDKIAAVQTGPGNKPMKDVRMKVSVIK